MVTGNDDEEVARRALEAGAFDYVCKPFTLEVLARVISAALVLGGRCRWRRGRRWGAPRLLHRWLDTWNGIGLIAGGAHRQDLRLSLSHIRGRVGVGVAPTLRRAPRGHPRRDTRTQGPGARWASRTLRRPHGCQVRPRVSRRASAAATRSRSSLGQARRGPESPSRSTYVESASSVPTRQR